MSQKKSKPKLCDDCRNISSYFEKSKGYDCRKDGPFCQVDRRLAQLLSEFYKRPQKLSDLIAISKEIQEAFFELKLNVESGKISYPNDVDEFLSTLKSMHSSIFQCTGHPEVGKFRISPILYGAGSDEREGMEPSEIEAVMRELYKTLPTGPSLERIDEKGFLRKCAIFLEELFTIHPFIDGNGRIGRMFLVLMALRSKKFKFLSFHDSGKNSKEEKKYVDALAFARRHLQKRRDGDHSNVKTDPYFLLVTWLSKNLDREASKDKSENPPDWISPSDGK